MHPFSPSAPLLKGAAILTPAELDALLFGHFPEGLSVQPSADQVSSWPVAFSLPAGDFSSRVQLCSGMTGGQSGH